MARRQAASALRVRHNRMAYESKITDGKSWNDIPTASRRVSTSTI